MHILELLCGQIIKTITHFLNLGCNGVRNRTQAFMFRDNNSFCSQDRSETNSLRKPTVTASL